MPQNFFFLRSWDRASLMYLSITNSMQRYTMIFIAINTLHVPGGSSAHHQELKTVYTASGICRAFTDSYRLREWLTPETCTVFIAINKYQCVTLHLVGMPKCLRTWSHYPTEADPCVRAHWTLIRTWSHYPTEAGPCVTAHWTLTAYVYSKMA
jgi:hypothetical protein